MTNNNIFKEISDLAFENSTLTSNLSSSVITLDALQEAVSDLMEDVDSALLNGCFANSNMSHRAFKEIERKLRVIDKAFYHSNLDIQEEVSKVELSADKLCDMVRNNKDAITEKAPAGTGAIENVLSKQ